MAVTRITFCRGLKVVWMEELHIQSVLLRIVIASVQTYKIKIKKRYFINIGIYRIKIRGSLPIIIISSRHVMYSFFLRYRVKAKEHYSQPPPAMPALHFLSIAVTATGPMMVLSIIAQMAIKNSSSSNNGVGV